MLFRSRVAPVATVDLRKKRREGEDMFSSSCSRWFDRGSVLNLGFCFILFASAQLADAVVQGIADVDAPLCIDSDTVGTIHSDWVIPNAVFLKTSVIRTRSSDGRHMTVAGRVNTNGVVFSVYNDDVAVRSQSNSFRASEMCFFCGDEIGRAHV